MTQARTKPTISVIDWTFGRVDAITTAFEDAAIVQYVTGPRENPVWKRDRHTIEPVEPLFVLRHTGGGEWRAVEGHGKWCNTVLYSGGGDSHPEMVKAVTEIAEKHAVDVERIWEPVDREAVGRAIVACDFLAYFQQQPAQRMDRDRPVALRKPQFFNVLPALAILCQGYLAAIVATGDEGEHDGEIACALELMGWNKLPEEVRDRIRDSIRCAEMKKQGPVLSSAAWWKGPFYDEHKSRGHSGELHDWMVEEAQKEWTECDRCGSPNPADLPEELVELLKFAEPIEPTTVAQVYNELAAQLRARRKA